MTALSDPIFRNALLTACSMSVACAVLSVPVVLRRWAFIGEGISHSGFGGAGTAWVLALLVPSMDVEWMPYAFVVIFCLATALGIGWMSRSEHINADAAIGIFLVATLAWGILAQQIYLHARHATPGWFDNLLFGQMKAIGADYALAAAGICAAVVIVVVALGKEITAYCFDPMTARTGGVRAGFVHYLLMLLIAITIVIGVRVTGSVLVTAMLILPGAAALALSRRLGVVMAMSVAIALVGSVVGLLLSRCWPFLPAGPAIVLALVLQFVIAMFVRRVRG